MNKTHRIRILGLLLALGTAGGLSAQQITDYDFAYTTVDYQTIVGTDGVHSIAFSNADDGYETFAMPFSMPWGESTIDSGANLHVTANGFVKFEGFSYGGSTPHTLWTTTSNVNKIIVPFVLADGYCNAAGAGCHWADTLDDEGRRVLIIEYRNISTYTNHTSTGIDLNYQVRLYDDGQVSIVFDESLYDGSFNCNIVIANGYADKVCLTGSWSVPVAASPTSLPSLGAMPPAGSCYSFSRPANYCVKPAAFTAGNGTTTTFDLSWSGSAESYTLFWSTSDTVWTDSIDVDDSTFTVEALYPSTLYHFGLRANCADGGHSKLVTTTGQTECSSIPTAAMPYMQDFENCISNADFVPCWVRWYKNYQGNLSTGYGQWDNQIIFTTSESQSGQRSLRLQVTPQASSGVDHQWCLVALPLFDDPVQSLQLAFSHKCSQPGGALIEVGFMTDRQDTATFDPYDTVSPTDQWDTAFIDLVSYSGEGQYIALRYWADVPTSPYGGSTYYCYLDDISVMATPTCVRPTAIVVDSVGHNTAWLSIVDSNVGEYMITYVGGGDSMTTIFYGLSGTLEGLEAATYYSVSASKMCPDGTSPLRVTTQFTTACHYLLHEDLPLQENFDSVVPATGSTLAPCWTVLNLHPSMGGIISSYQSHGDPTGSSLYMYADSATRGQFISLPAVDNVSDLTLSFWTYCTNNNARLEVGVMEDPTDTSTFTSMALIEPQATSLWNAEWEKQEVGFASYSGTGRHITLRNRNTTALSGYSIYVDDIQLAVASSCPHPTGVSIVAATTSSLTIAIDDTAATGNYRIWYTLDGTEVSADSYNTEYTIEGLEASTTYTISVASVCDDGELTEAVSTTGTTLCGAIAASELPWSEDFEGWTTGPHEQLGSCWLAYFGNDASADATDNRLYPTNNSGHTAIRLYGRHTYSDGYQQSTVVLPQVDVNPRLLKLDVKMRFGALTADEGDYLECGIMSNPMDPATFVPCAIINHPGNYNYHTFSVDFGRFEGESGAVALRYHYDVPNDWYYAYIDSVALTLLDEEATACQLSTPTVSDTTDSTATIQWTYDCPTTGYDVQLRHGDEDVMFSTATTSITLEGLQPAQLYSVKVRPQGTDAFWSDQAFFTTPTTPDTPDDPDDPDTPDNPDNPDDPDTPDNPDDPDDPDTPDNPDDPDDPEDPDTPDNPDTTGIADVTLIGEVAISPNPASRQATVTCTSRARLTLLDATGHTVLTTPAATTHRLDVGTLAKGVYFVALDNGTTRTVKKLIVR